MRNLAIVTAALAAALLLAFPAAADPCADAETQKERNDCTQMDARNAEAKLNEVREAIYERLEEANLGEQTAAFEQAREHFTSYVNSHCQAVALRAGDESTFPQLLETCRAEGFRARTLELEQIYGQ